MTARSASESCKLCGFPAVGRVEIPGLSGASWPVCQGCLDVSTLVHGAISRKLKKHKIAAKDIETANQIGGMLSRIATALSVRRG